MSIKPKYFFPASVPMVIAGPADVPAMFKKFADDLPSYGYDLNEVPITNHVGDLVAIASYEADSGAVEIKTALKDKATGEIRIGDTVTDRFMDYNLSSRDYPIHWVALEETYGLADDAKAEAGRYWGLYFYNDQEVTCLCSPEGNFFLNQFGHESEHRMSDALDGDLRGEFDDGYRTCRSIEAVADGLRGVEFFERNGQDDAEFNATVREWFNGNPPCPALPV